MLIIVPDTSVAFISYKTMPCIENAKRKDKEERKRAVTDLIKVKDEDKRMP